MDNQHPQDQSKVLLPPTTKGHNMVRLFSLLLLVITPLITIENFGFTSDGEAPLFHLSDTVLWAIIVIVGLFCGIACAPKKWILSAISGIVAAVAMNGFIILYASFRESLYALEFAIPLVLGAFLGSKVFKLLGGGSLSEEQ